MGFVASASARKSIRDKAVALDRVAKVVRKDRRILRGAGAFMTKKKPNAARGRRPVPIGQDPQQFEIAAWWAFHGDGCGPFDAARRALLAVKGGPITVEDIEGVLHRASATVPLPP